MGKLVFVHLIPNLGRVSELLVELLILSPYGSLFNALQYLRDNHHKLRTGKIDTGSDG